MGSHHQFQDIQGLASQQPASADMVFLGLGGWRRSGGALPAVLSRDGLEFLAAPARTIFVRVADVCAYGPKRGRRRGRAARWRAGPVQAWWR